MLLLILFGRHACFFSENICKITLIRKAEYRGNFYQGIFRIYQHITGSFHLLIRYIGADRLPGFCFEKT